MLFENKGPDACKSMTALTDSPTKSRRFTIKAFLFWTAVVIGAVPVAMAEPNYPITVVFFVGIYLTVVCGLATLIRIPRSLDAWIPLAVALTPFVLSRIGIYLLPPSLYTEFIYILFFAGLPIGIFLLIRNTKRIKRTGFSLTVFVYHLGVWLVWLGISLVGIFLPI